MKQWHIVLLLNRGRWWSYSRVDQCEGYRMRWPTARKRCQCGSGTQLASNFHQNRRYQSSHFHDFWKKILLEIFLMSKLHTYIHFPSVAPHQKSNISTMDFIILNLNTAEIFHQNESLSWMVLRFSHFINTQLSGCRRKKVTTGKLIRCCLAVLCTRWSLIFSSDYYLLLFKMGDYKNDF